MKSNGGADESSRLLRELQSLKDSKRDIDARISVIEAQLQQIQSNQQSNQKSSSDCSYGCSELGHDLTPDMIYRYSRQLLLPVSGHPKSFKIVDFIDPRPGDLTSKTTTFTKTAFVSSGMSGDTLSNVEIIKERESNPSPSNNQTTKKESKSRKQKSCFKCHEKGHVSSCCPNKRKEAGYKSLHADGLGTKLGLGAKPVSTQKREASRSISPHKPKRQTTKTDHSYDKYREYVPSRFRTEGRHSSQFEIGSTSRSHEKNHEYRDNRSSRFGL